MTPLTILIPAAGASTRMAGKDKLLQDVGGQPLLRRQTEMALATGLPVLVTLRPGDSARKAALAGQKLRMIEVPDAATGMSASLRCAAKAVSTALMILPADMPDLTTTDLQVLIAAFDQAPHRIHRGASVTGQPGHPVILPAAYLAEMTGLSGDEGARSLVARDGAILVPLPRDHAITDLDTPEEWDAWRKRAL